MSGGCVRVRPVTTPSRRLSRSKFASQVQEADTAFLTVALTDIQTERLAAWHTRATRGPFGGNPDRHSIEVDADRWSRLPYWSGRLPYSGIVKLSRGDLSDVAYECSNSGSWLSLLTASFAWGSGRNGYGPRRLADILEETSAREIGAALTHAVGHLRGGGAEPAYRNLVGTVRNWGPAFFTKFLYFAGSVTAGPAPAPLILDKRVATALRPIAATAYQRAALPEPDALAAWLWTDSGWSPHRYEQWLIWADHITKALTATVPGWPPRPDILELALFCGALTSIELLPPQ